MIVIEADMFGKILGLVLGCFITAGFGYASFVIATDREFGMKGYQFGDALGLSAIIGLTILGVLVILWSLGWFVIK